MEPKKRLWIWRLGAAALVLAVVIVLPLHVYASECSSRQSGTWDDPTTWEGCGGLAPGPGDSAAIDAGQTVTLTRDTSVNILTVTGTLDTAAYDLTLTDGGSFSSTGTVTGSGTVQTQGGVSLLGDGICPAQPAGPGSGSSVTELLAQSADAARNIIGPAPVAAAEDLVYQSLDLFNRLRYGITGSAPTWQLAAGTPAPGGTPAEGADATVAVDAVPASPPPADQLPPATPPVAAWALSTTPSTVAQTDPGTLTSLIPVITRPPLAGEGIWQPLPTAAQPAGEAPILWQTVFRPDPDRPFAKVALVAMDLSRSRLHLVIGTQEPVSAIAKPELRAGVIPTDTQASGSLLAAWNGGFRAIHGQFGMMTDGVTWLPAQDGLATVAIDRQGHATLGAWGREIDPQGDWLAWRQNNEPLIERGQVDPDVIKYATTFRWGASVDGAVFIWRSALGLTPGHRWLIYAAGNSLSVATLTAALQAAGVSDAMQLDANTTYPRFVTFASTKQVVTVNGSSLTLPLTALRLVDEMYAGPTQFLVPYARDFMYLTVQSAGREPVPTARAARK
jgi:hypothetical protein